MVSKREYEQVGYRLGEKVVDESLQIDLGCCTVCGDITIDGKCVNENCERFYKNE